MHVNNEVGSIQPIHSFGNILKDYPKIFFHVDGVQGYAKVPVNLKEWGVDLYTFSSHKINGPKGAGALYVRNGVNLFPQMSGGGQEEGKRSGTENIPSIVGFAKACQIAREICDAKKEKMSNLKSQCIKLLKEMIPHIVINGPEGSEASPYILNLSIPGLKGEILVHALEREGVFVSTGSACSSKKDIVSPVLKAMAINKEVMRGSIRVSFSYQTEQEDISFFIDKLAKVEKQLR
jgi:cysteine desulfurase